MTLKDTTTTIKIPQGETNSFEINSGVRQGDALSATLFNIVLEKIIRATNCKGTIVNRESQILAYADDVVIIARTKRGMTEILRIIKEEASKIGLNINENKTKYMRCSRRDDNNSEITIDNCVFEQVENFNYLGVMINNRNERRSEIKQKIQAGNRAYHANKNILRDKQIKKKTKIKLYKSLIRPVLTYAAEVICITKREEEELKIFERKVLRMIVGPTRLDNGEYRAKTNAELREVMDGEDIVKFIKAQRLRWLGHVIRADREETINAIVKWKPNEVRARGRPRVRWWDGVMGDLEKMGVRGWRQLVMDRTAWRAVINNAKIHKDL